MKNFNVALLIIISAYCQAVEPPQRNAQIAHQNIHPLQRDASESDECCVCLDPLERNVVELPCGHSLHDFCVKRIVDKMAGLHPLCPLCRKEFDAGAVQPQNNMQAAAGNQLSNANNANAAAPMGPFLGIGVGALLIGIGYGIYKYYYSEAK